MDIRDLEYELNNERAVYHRLLNKSINNPPEEDGSSSHQKLRADLKITEVNIGNLHQIIEQRSVSRYRIAP